MNIKKSYEISVPRIGKILFSNGDEFVFNIGPNLHCTAPQLMELREAIDKALELTAEEIAPDDPEPASEQPPRVWGKYSSEPLGVEAVSDKDGDVWDRRGDGRWQYEDLIYTWGQVMNDYGPVTEVTS